MTILAWGRKGPPSLPQEQEGCILLLIPSLLYLISKGRFHKKFLSLALDHTWLTPLPYD